MFKSSAFVILVALAVVHLVPSTAGLRHPRIQYRRFAEELSNNVADLQEQEEKKQEEQQQEEQQQEVRDLVNLAEAEKVKKTLHDFSALAVNYALENVDKEFEPQIRPVLNTVAEHEFTDVPDFIAFWTDIVKKIYEPIFKQIMLDDADSSESNDKDSDEW